MPTLNKLEYLDETKQQIKSALNTNFNSQITDEDTFRSYVSKIDNIYTNWPKVTGEGASVNLSNTKKGKMTISPKGNSEQDTLTGINLLAFPYYETTKTINDITFTVKDDNTIHVQGTASAKTEFLIRNRDINLNITEGETYTLATSGLGTIDSTIWLDMSGQTGNFLDKWALTQNTPYTSAVAQSKDIKPFIRISVENGATVNTDVKVWLYKGTYSSSITYEQYCGGYPSPNPDYPQNVKVVTGNNTIVVSDGTNTDNYPLNLGSIELCKIGNYQDYIYKDNGKWYKHSEIGKVVLDGTENWSHRAFPDNSYLSIKMTLNVGENGGFCNYFISDNRYDITPEHMTISKQWKELCFAILKSRLTTEDEAGFKDWLSTNTPIVYYVLETPTDTEITDNDLIGQLEQVFMSYDNPTNITSTYATGNSQIIISASALKKGGN